MNTDEVAVVRTVQWRLTGTICDRRWWGKSRTIGVSSAVTLVDDNEVVKNNGTDTANQLGRRTCQSNANNNSAAGWNCSGVFGLARHYLVVRARMVLC